MTTITVTRDDTGKIVGCSETDKRAWLRFIALVKRLECGEFFELDYWFPRNAKFHRLHFAMLKALFDAQEQFTDPKQMRAWLQVGAGHAKFVPGPGGQIVAIPESISFRKIDDEAFREHHAKVKDFMRSSHAQEYLWRHLSPEEQMNKVESILMEYER